MERGIKFSISQAERGVIIAVESESRARFNWETSFLQPLRRYRIPTTQELALASSSAQAIALRSFRRSSLPSPALHVTDIEYTTTQRNGAGTTFRSAQFIATHRATAEISHDSDSDSSGTPASTLPPIRARASDARSSAEWSGYLQKHGTAAVQEEEVPRGVRSAQEEDPVTFLLAIDDTWKSFFQIHTTEDHPAARFIRDRAVFWDVDPPKYLNLIKKRTDDRIVGMKTSPAFSLAKALRTAIALSYVWGEIQPGGTKATNLDPYTEVAPL
ncbi:hypothetical protein F5146DRAFT_1141754 [Armillaria mellea]|nr:hypothetical protein F5146DRAFT_1141754 [Armillaria mellea]